MHLSKKCLHMGKKSMSVSDFPFENFDYKYLAANMKYHKLDGKAIRDMSQEEINRLIEAIWYSFPEVDRELCAACRPGKV